MANHNKRKQHDEPMRTEANTRNQRQARENACDQVAIGFASDWLSRWREFFKLISYHTAQKAKPKQFRITFDTQLKTTVIRQPFYTDV